MVYEDIDFSQLEEYMRNTLNAIRLKIIEDEIDKNLKDLKRFINVSKSKYLLRPKKKLGKLEFKLVYREILPSDVPERDRYIKGFSHHESEAYNNDKLEMTKRLDRQIYESRLEEKKIREKSLVYSCPTCESRIPRSLYVKLKLSNSGLKFQSPEKEKVEKMSLNHFFQYRVTHGRISDGKVAEPIDVSGECTAEQSSDFSAASGAEKGLI